MWSKRINYISFVILVAVGLVFYHHYMLFLMLVIMIVSPIVSYVVTRRSLDKFEIVVSADKASIGKNIPTDIYFTVDNKSIIPVEDLKLDVKLYNHFYHNDEEYNIIIAAIPRKVRQTKISVTGIYCGRMVAEIERATIYDAFGMFRFAKDIKKRTEIYIMPSKSDQFENVAISTLGVSEDEQLQTKKGDDVSQISEIRNYIPGDKLQNIHWKLSAKSDELQVKEFSLPYSEDVIILVELYVEEETPDTFDELIEVLYAFSMDLIQQGRKFNIIWKNSEYNFKNMEVNNDDDLNLVIRELFFAKIQKHNGEAYDLYISLNSEIKGTILYLSNTNAVVKSGEKLDIGSERVMLTCLQ